MVKVSLNNFKLLFIVHNKMKFVFLISENAMATPVSTYKNTRLYFDIIYFRFLLNENKNLPHFTLNAIQI